MLFTVAIIQFSLFLQLKNLIAHFSSHDGGNKRFDFDGIRFGWKAIMVWVVNTYVVVIHYCAYCIDLYPFRGRGRISAPHGT